MVEYIGNSDNGDNNPREEKLNASQIQNLFFLVTGKKSKLSKSYYNPSIYSKEEVLNLHNMIRQTLETRYVSGMNYDITVRYTDDFSESHKDIGIFDKIVNTASIMSIIVTYNFFIRMPQENNLQNYKINISLSSTAAAKINAKSRGGFFIGDIFGSSLLETGSYEIEYSDYLVGTDISNCINRWFNSLKNGVKIPKNIGLYTTYIPATMRFSTSAFVVYLIYKYGDNIFYNNNFDNLKYIPITIIGGFILIDIVTFTGRRIEGLVDSLSSDSYFNITKSDRELISNKQNKIVKKIVKSFFYLIITIVLNLVADMLAAKI
ncbi:MAG: hypothetical protein ACYCY0_02665 [Acidithiobacillus ferrivorans]